MAVSAFTIDRQTWLNGEWLANNPSFPSLLRNDDGMKCCLGFYAEACGVGEAQITGIATPERIANLPEEMRWLTIRPELRPSPACADLTDTNDREPRMMLNQTTREAKIIELFAKQNIAVSFVN